MLTGRLGIPTGSSFTVFKAYRPSGVFSYPDISSLFSLTEGLISLDLVELVESCRDRSVVGSGEAPMSKISPSSSLGSIFGADSVDEVMEGGGCCRIGGGLSMSKMDLGGLVVC